MYERQNGVRKETEVKVILKDCIRKIGENAITLTSSTFNLFNGFSVFTVFPQDFEIEWTFRREPVTR